ncbi:M91 family zinc metallopeptidase [Pseudomonas synxantha]|uniref:Hemolysin-like protein n=1 Tax=Pseudomonas synxantha TaxID=47883 RepID=A0ABS0UDD3_9PSED|nr:M91 family zinc metallopeptidase [Pseudomonas synxantha]MBI6563581.1 hemolysin-like protein [Pseudomonas synxantha]MBI6579795.1 hemolysin-like protein [Pseudomonas synxantha]MBI6644193.1 hemolysin-like protein [Pseudomonas synxantha]
MLFPLAYLATTYTDSRSSAPASHSAPSFYDPPPDLEPGVYNHRLLTLHSEGEVKISRLLVWDPSSDVPTIKRNYLMVETGASPDHIHVGSWPGDRLRILINDKAYFFSITPPQGPEQSLLIATKGGRDSVIIDDDVKLRATVEGGGDDDYLQAGGGRTSLYGGKGRDVMRLGSGLGYAEGNDDDDALIGGSGNAAMYGNNGKDLLIGGFGPESKQIYMDGGNDDDALLSGSGRTVVHGGNGDDVFMGAGRTTYYTGKGQDSIRNNRHGDRIYGNAGDDFDRTSGSTFTEVKPSDAGMRGFTLLESVESTEQENEDFRQRVADDLEFLRSSPIGQQALTEMDALAALNHGKVSIAPISQDGSHYEFDSTELDNLTEQQAQNLDGAAFGEMKNGVAGSRANRGVIYYDPAQITENSQHTHLSPPVSVLFHELAHAYNGATGTFLPGETLEASRSGGTNPVNNFERQAVGLTDDNPRHFTENGLYEEMGTPSRPNYHKDSIGM